MSLISRVTRLIKSDVHGILDVLEDPEAILKQAIRDMEEEVEKSVTQLKVIENKIERYTSTQQDLSTKLTHAEEQIDFAFTENNESLIKSLLRKKLEIVQQTEMTKNNCQILEDNKAKLETETKEQKDKLKSIIDKLNLFSEQPSYCDTSSLDDYTNYDRSKSISDDDIELAFLKEKLQRKAQSSAITETGVLE